MRQNKAVCRSLACELPSELRSLTGTKCAFLGSRMSRKGTALVQLSMFCALRFAGEARAGVRWLVSEEKKARVEMQENGGVSDAKACRPPSGGKIADEQALPCCSV